MKRRYEVRAGAFIGGTNLRRDTARANSNLPAILVNIVLFEPGETDRPLLRSDRRGQHILNLLRRKTGETFDAGVIDGPRGKATITSITETTIELKFAALTPPAPSIPLALIIGLPRPQTARDILRDATTLGVGSLNFVPVEKSEASYAQSTLWRSGEWRRCLIAGAEQAFDTRLPDVTHGRSLGDTVAALPPNGLRLVLDNYESAQSIGGIDFGANHVTLAVGGERGWSANERAHFRAEGFQFVHLGSRVLRTETAVTAALALVRVRLRLM